MIIGTEQHLGLVFNRVAITPNLENMVISFHQPGQSKRPGFLRLMGRLHLHHFIPTWSPVLGLVPGDGPMGFSSHQAWTGEGPGKKYNAEAKQ